jgi:hypothetical protein
MTNTADDPLLSMLRTTARAIYHRARGVMGVTVDDLISAGWLAYATSDAGTEHARRARARGAMLDEVRGALSWKPGGTEKRVEQLSDSTPGGGVGRPARSRLPRAVKRSLGRLTEKQRRVLWLWTVRGWGHEEIAKSFGVGVGTSARLRHDALARLRKLLGAGRCVSRVTERGTREENMVGPCGLNPSSGSTGVARLLARTVPAIGLLLALPIQAQREPCYPQGVRTTFLGTFYELRIVTTEQDKPTRRGIELPRSGGFPPMCIGRLVLAADGVNWVPSYITGQWERVFVVANSDSLKQFPNAQDSVSAAYDYRSAILVVRRRMLVTPLPSANPLSRTRIKVRKDSPKPRRED